MRTIIYIPLDERPCNLAYPARLFKATDDIKLLVPPSEILGHKKKPANISGIRAFINSHASEANALVYSTEMVVYGGLLPSRIYPVSDQLPGIGTYEQFVHALRENNPNLLIYASNLIMRTPRYSSADEEPAYYENFGKEIFRHGWLTDKQKRVRLSEDEAHELAQLRDIIPRADIKDYEMRRAANLEINLANIDLVKQDVINFLTIPQDDSAPYGYTAADQAKVYPAIKQERLQSKIATYPGADEAGYTLLARAIQHLTNHSLKIYPLFASSIGANAVPLYEDRPMITTVQSHILATGAQISLSPNEADLILAVNTPGREMINAKDQLEHPNITYDTFRNLRAFVSQIAQQLRANRPVALADSAYGNGSDLELLNMLDDQQLLSRLTAYRGWNTDANTVGSTIATAIILQNSSQKEHLKEILSSVFDDGFYQAIVRGETTENWLPKRGLSYFDLKDQATIVSEHVAKELIKFGHNYLTNTLETITWTDLQINFPWNRMFEIHLVFTNMEVL